MRWFLSWRAVRGAAALLALLALLCLWPAAGLAGAPELGRYVNARYGYAIDYPLAFTPRGESANGDGQVFASPDGRGEMRVFASRNAPRRTLQDRYRESLAALGTRPLFTLLRDDWFVVSGIAGGKVVYEKTLFRRDAFFTVAFAYDPAARAAFEAVVGRVVRSLEVK